MTGKPPVFLCEPSGPGQSATWRFWCPLCRKYHTHGGHAGHRAPHCHTEEVALHGLTVTRLSSTPAITRKESKRYVLLGRMRRQSLAISVLRIIGPPVSGTPFHSGTSAICFSIARSRRESFCPEAKISLARWAACSSPPGGSLDKRSALSIRSSA
jgi:hypothetical protein